MMYKPKWRAEYQIRKRKRKLKRKTNQVTKVMEAANLAASTLEATDKVDKVAIVWHFKIITTWILRNSVPSVSSMPPPNGMTAPKPSTETNPTIICITAARDDTVVAADAGPPDNSKATDAGTTDIIKRIGAKEIGINSSIMDNMGTIPNCMSRPLLRDLIKHLLAPPPNGPATMNSLFATRTTPVAGGFWSWTHYWHAVDVGTYHWRPIDLRNHKRKIFKNDTDASQLQTRMQRGEGRGIGRGIINRVPPMSYEMMPPLSDEITSSTNSEINKRQNYTRWDCSPSDNSALRDLDHSDNRNKQYTPCCGNGRDKKQERLHALDNYVIKAVYE